MPGAVLSRAFGPVLAASLLFAQAARGQAPEAPDLSGITTVKEYAYVPSARLPQVKDGAVAGYKWNKDAPVVRFPINVWIGWLPLIAANHGARPNEESVFFRNSGFKVELVLVDDPVATRDGYVAGEWPILWSTVDMLVLFSEGLMKDTRTAPRVFQQVSWSNGGDGVVVREGIKSVKDLKGRTIVYAQNSPSQYYINALLLYAGLAPGDVKHKYTATAFEAAAAFVDDKTIDACVSWAPDIYNIVDRVKGTRLLSTTADANKLLADVWAVRADFARDHPEIVRGLVEGIFQGMRDAKSSPEKAFKWMADVYSMLPDDAAKMAKDARSTNFAENCQFLLNQNNPTNFEATWNSAKYVYRKLGLVDSPGNFDQVLDFCVVKAIREGGAFKDDVDESQPGFKPEAGGSAVLTTTIRINFFPNSADLHEPARDEYGNVLADRLYDPKVDETMRAVAEAAAKFGRARLLIVGHSDSSMKGEIPEQQVTELSKKRAQAVKDELVTKYGFAAGRIDVDGKGWGEPADPEHPENQALNRRVEIIVLKQKED